MINVPIQNQKIIQNYYDNPAMSQSKIKVLLNNPRIFYLEYILGQKIDKPTPSKNLGTCLDLALTEPEKYKNLIIKNTKTTTMVNCITQYWKDQIDLWIYSLNNYIFDNDFFGSINLKDIFKTCIKQKELYYKYNNIEWKMKPDFLNVNNGFFIDLKSTCATNYDDFIKDFIKFGYYIQAASYANGMQTYYKLDYLPRAYFVAISTITGEIFAIECGERLMELGLIEINRACNIYKQNLISNEWAKNEKSKVLDLPLWKEQQILDNNNVSRETF